MLEKRSAEAPDIGALGSTDNLGKTEETKQRTKKKSSLLPWVVGAGLAFGGWYFYDKRKKAQALETMRQAELQRQGEQAEGQTEHPGPSGGVTSSVQRESSTSERLRAMGINTSCPSCYQSGEPHKQL